MAEVFPAIRRKPTLEISLAVMLALAIATVFWTQQRYPSLLKKLHAGTAQHVKGPISFDALLSVTPQMPTSERVMRTTANWLWTNRFGMYFALPFGAMMMTGLALTARPKRFRTTAANVLCGAAAGAPLGVCTNCATPVAQSLLQSGASTRLTVAAMVSSPMFNPVVVAMAFVLFPWRLAALRVLIPAILLLLLPWILPETQGAMLGNQFEVASSLRFRVLAFFRLFFKNLLRLTVLTLPWMLLAAVLGALAAETIPVYGTHLPVSVLSVIGVAILGTLLPVPMAFDVALSWVLYQAGVPVCYVAALLCTLGVVSVYSLSAIGAQLGYKVSFKLAGATATLGTIAGLLTLWLPH